MEQAKTPTKKCKACQKEIDPKAKICPYCRTKQTSKAVNVIAGIITIVVIIWVIGLIFGGSKSSIVSTAPALSSNGSSSATTSQQSNSPTPNSPTHDDLMKQNNPDIKHLTTLTADYVGKSFVLYANAEVQNYYNYGFDNETMYYSLKLWDNSVNGDYDGVYGYIDRTNPNSKALVEKILNGSTFLKINASIPIAKYMQNTNAFLQLDGWEEVK